MSKKDYSPEPKDEDISDVRLKRDVGAAGSLPDGLKLYKFRYLWDETEYVGVMAQDVLKVCPEAVSTGEDGFYRVNYGLLGTRMMTLDEWNTLQTKDVGDFDVDQSPEPPAGSDIRLKRDIAEVFRVSPEPPVSDIRLKRDIVLIGNLSHR
jgi:hypothetical protein